MINGLLRLYFYLGHAVGRLAELADYMCELTRQAIFKGTNQARRKGHTLAAETNDPKERANIMDWCNGEATAVEYEGDYIIR